MGVMASISSEFSVSSLDKFANMLSNDEVDGFEDGAVIEVGSCKACVTASTSPRWRAGGGDCKRGGRGGIGEVGLAAKIALGGGGSGPAVACTPLKLN